MNMESKNTVFVGGKPTAVYVTAAVVISKNYDEVFEYLDKKQTGK